MKIDGQFYVCGGCNAWQPFMGEDVTCDCGHSNDFLPEEISELESAAEEERA